MAASIGVIASPSQSAGYFERDSYYARDDAAHLVISSWVGRGVAALQLSGPVDSDAFSAILEGSSEEDLRMPAVLEGADRITRRRTPPELDGSRRRS